MSQFALLHLHLHLCFMLLFYIHSAYVLTYSYMWNSQLIYQTALKAE